MRHLNRKKTANRNGVKRKVGKGKGKVALRVIKYVARMKVIMRAEEQWSEGYQ